MQQSEFVFAYGSNMDPDQMKERCPESDLSWFVAEAREYKLWFPRKSDKRKGGVGSIKHAPNNNSSVWGVVFAVTPRDRKRLDHFEGVNSGSYQHHRLDVVDLGGTTHHVLTYIAVSPQGRAKRYQPHEDYIKLYVRGAEYFGLPPEYIGRLRKIKVKKERKKTKGQSKKRKK